MLAIYYYMICNFTPEPSIRYLFGVCVFPRKDHVWLNVQWECKVLRKIISRKELAIIDKLEHFGIMFKWQMLCHDYNTMYTSKRWVNWYMTFITKHNKMRCFNEVHRTKNMFYVMSVSCLLVVKAHWLRQYLTQYEVNKVINTTYIAGLSILEWLFGIL